MAKGRRTITYALNGDVHFAGTEEPWIIPWMNKEINCNGFRATGSLASAVFIKTGGPKAFTDIHAPERRSKKDRLSPYPVRLQPFFRY